MLSFTVRLRFDEGDREAVTAMLRDLTLASRQEPGCVSYIPHWVEDTAATVLIYEQYQDEAALEFHRNTPHFHQYATEGLYRRMLERELEKLSAIA